MATTNYIEYIQLPRVAPLSSSTSYASTTIEPIVHPRAEEAARRGITVEELLELERKTALGDGVVFEDTSSDAQNYYKATASNDPEINQREQARRAEGKQKAKQETAKAAEAIVGLTMPSTYINTALDWNRKEKISDAASMAVDLALPIVGSGIKGGAQLLKSLIPVAKTAGRNHIIRTRERIMLSNNATPSMLKSRKTTIQSTGLLPVPTRTTTSVVSTSSAPRSTFQIIDNGQPLNETIDLAEAAARNQQLRPNQWKFGNVPFNKGKVLEDGHYVPLKRVYEPGEEALLEKAGIRHPSHADELIQLESPWSKRGSMNSTYSIIPASVGDGTVVNYYYSIKDPVVQVPNDTSNQYNNESSSI